MSAPNGNGNGDWASSFAAFYDRHRDKDKKKLKFTGVFNAAMEALMAEPQLDMEWRCLAFAWRYSWGNNSDFCIDKMGGDRIGQKECAARLGVKKQRVSDGFLVLKGLYYIEPDKGYVIFPVDDPSERRAKSPAPSGLSDTQITQFQAWCADWKVRYLADSRELESAEETVNRIKKVRLGLYRESVRVARKRDEGGGTPLTTTLQHVEDAGERVVLLEEHATEQPARPPETALLKTGLNQRGLFPDDELVDQLTAGLGTTPVEHFFRVIDQRLERGRIGTGLLMKQAAKARDSYVPAPEPTTEKCWSCGQPIAGASVNGACLDCCEAQMAKGAAS